MALPHARPLDVIAVRPLGAALAEAVSTSLLKTDRLQLLHLVLPAHKDQPEHHVDDECTIHCLEGDVEVVMPGGNRRLGPGQLVVLPARQRHSLRARSDCAVLMTLLLHHGDAGDHGGAGAQSLKQQ
jgi:quercetin dioxygenase-like cupin family protein